MIFNNPSASIPQELRTDWFIARPLTEEYAEIDYEAYMASPNVIPVHGAGRWQVEGFTLEENRRLVADHTTDHATHRRFAFILLSPDETRSVGCVYFNPLQEFLDRAITKGWGAANDKAKEAMVTFWMREDEQEGELPDIVVRSVETWLHQEWQFKGHFWRIRNEEIRSMVAMEQAGLERRFGVAVDKIGRYNFWG
jgi:RimJ/RimL family protein N-acetyltransferase